METSLYAWLEGALDARGLRAPSTLHRDAASVVEQFPDTTIGLLASRGLVHWFDLEGQFFEEGAHAGIIRDMLASCGVKAEVRDRWVERQGWRLWVTANGVTTEFFCEVADARQQPSDYGEPDLMITAVETVSGYRVVPLNTGDQTVCFVCVPPDLYAGMIASGVLSELSEEDDPPEVPELMSVMPRSDASRTTRVVDVSR